MLANILVRKISRLVWAIFAKAISPKYEAQERNINSPITAIGIVQSARVLELNPSSSSGFSSAGMAGSRAAPTRTDSPNPIQAE